MMDVDRMAYQQGRPTVPLFALIIGIDDYPENWKLSGAVSDAKAIKQYFEDVLHVRGDHVSTLYNQEATRDAIIKAFQDICNDDRIKEGDPIVIFFAGHGGKLLAPDAWGPQEFIECLVPYGCEPVFKRRGVPVPDRTIGALIANIAKEKGDNITVIFDCCFSGSIDRDLPDEDEYVARTVDLQGFVIAGDLDHEIWGDPKETDAPGSPLVDLSELVISEDLDREIWGDREGAIAHGFAHGLRSHVLLAACQKDELAYERKGGCGGQFTGVLLQKLENRAVNNITYAELIEEMQLRRQHPVCAGFNQHRILFNKRVPAGGQVRHLVQVQRGGKYVISAGLAHGISPGVEFTMYDDSKRELGVVLVDEGSLIKNFETTVTAPIHTGVSFARLTRVGMLPLYVDPSLGILLRAGGYGTSAQAFQLVAAEKAKLEVSMENGYVIFKVLDKLVKGYGLMQLPYQATLDSLVHVLGYAARYYWFLGLEKEPDLAKSRVSVDFYRLRIDYDDYGFPDATPYEQGLCQEDPDLGGSPVIDFVVEEETYYGAKITNNTGWDLYLNVLVFNNGSLSIVPYYIQTTAGEPEAPLKKGGTFTMGYGPGGTAPFSYSLKQGQDIDVGYLKIIFATRPIDLSDIVQPSPFLSIDARDGDASRGGGWGLVKAVVLTALSLQKPDTWFTLDIPIVQRRGTAT